MKFLKIVAYKLSDGLWAFDHPHNDTIEELLCNGTEEVIDSHYYFSTGKDAVAGDRMRIHLSDEEPDDWDTLLVKEVGDEEGTTYTDTTLCSPVWLCNWLQGYFGFVPEELYVKVRPINKGLKGFVNRTGMRKMMNK